MRKTKWLQWLMTLIAVVLFHVMIRNGEVVLFSVKYWIALGGMMAVFLLGEIWGLLAHWNVVFSIQNGIFKSYRGMIGTIEYDPDDKIYYGNLLHIYDSVSYHADNVSDLYDQYKMAVDFYLQSKLDS